MKNGTWSIVKRFSAEDFGAKNDLLFYVSYSWAWSLSWLNQDTALVMAHHFPMKLNATDWPYGGSVVLLYRDKNGEWQAGLHRAEESNLIWDQTTKLSC
jgi:hypothetical protein